MSSFRPNLAVFVSVVGLVACGDAAPASGSSVASESQPGATMAAGAMTKAGASDLATDGAGSDALSGTSAGVSADTSSADMPSNTSATASPGAGTRPVASDSDETQMQLADSQTDALGDGNLDNSVPGAQDDNAASTTDGAGDTSSGAAAMQSDTDAALNGTSNDNTQPSNTDGASGSGEPDSANDTDSNSGLDGSLTDNGSDGNASDSSDSDGNGDPDGNGSDENDPDGNASGGDSDGTGTDSTDEVDDTSEALEPDTTVQGAYTFIEIYPIFLNWCGKSKGCHSEGAEGGRHEYGHDDPEQAERAVADNIRSVLDRITRTQEDRGMMPAQAARLYDEEIEAIESWASTL